MTVAGAEYQARTPAGSSATSLENAVADEITTRIKRLKNIHSFSLLHGRMKQDQDFYDLNTFLRAKVLLPPDAVQHVSDIPRTYGDKVIAILSQQEIVVETPETPLQEIRRANSDLELFLRGMLRSVDDEQINISKPDIISQLAYQIAIRGWAVGRVLLNSKETSGRLFPDVNIWDAMNSVWQLDGDGIKWMATSKLIPYDIAQEHGLLRYNPYPQNSNENQILCWEYIDRQHYCLVTDGQPNNLGSDPSAGRFLVPPIAHGSFDTDGNPLCPGFVISNGARSPVNRMQGTNASDLQEVGESIYASARGPIADLNYIQTLWTQQAIDRTYPKYHVASEGGEKELDEAITDPENRVVRSRETTQVNRLDTEVDNSAGGLRQQYEIAYSNAVRATLPELTYGDPSRSFSGFALSQLDRNAQEKLLPFASSLERAVGRVMRLFKLHFQSSAVDTIEIIGPQGYNEGTVQKPISRLAIQVSSSFSIRLVPKYNRVTPEVLAQVIQATGSGLMSRKMALNLLGVPNASYEIDRLRMDQLEAIDPVLGLSAGVQAFARNGRLDQAQFAHRSLQRLYRSGEQEYFIRKAQGDLFLSELIYHLNRGNQFAAAQLIINMQAVGVGPFAQSLPATPTPLSPYGLPQPSLPNGGGGFTTGSTGSDSAYGTRPAATETTARQNTSNAQQPRGGADRQNDNRG